MQKIELMGDIRRKCQTLRYLATLFYRNKSFELALKYCHKVSNTIDAQKSEFFSTYEWGFQKSSLANIMGSIYLKLNKSSESYYQFCLALDSSRALPKHSDYYQLAPLRNLGRWYFFHQKYDKARQYFQECLELSTAIQRIDMIARVQLDIAQLAATLGKLEEAVSFADKSLSTASFYQPIIRELAAQFKEKLGHGYIFIDE